MTLSAPNPLPPPKERRRLREAHALTQAELASLVGVTRETVRAWETGRTTPRGRKRETYAKLLLTFATEAKAAAKAAAEAGPRTAVRQEEFVTHAVPAPLPAPVDAGSPVPTAEPVTGAGPEPAGPTAPSTPTQAFDALYTFCTPALVRQAYLLTGRRDLARESVERAFQLAWQRWPEVAVDRDPAGWVRSTAYDFALSPWHRFRPRYRHPEPPPPDPSDRALLDVLLKLPPSYRRTVLLYDGIGLGLPETAAETEASTPAAANRLLRAREAIAVRIPELAEPPALSRRLAELATTERLRASSPPAVRTDGERRARRWTRAAIVCTAGIIGATSLTLRTAPTHYEPPVAPGAAVQGLPRPVAQGALSEEEAALRAKLRAESQQGPERVLPVLR
ncbi:sigma factor-like helix-turn-helix DNA-binding protein [Streptomyces sp. NPDC005423]|uniref:sigma factor-like helix-turn-helix DNA-binding protein n=1 Tax=Streptomyces sp. NPDC005423 TaxID=3155343 RepID=UPI0033B25B1A